MPSGFIPGVTIPNEIKERHGACRGRDKPTVEAMKPTGGFDPLSLLEFS